MGRIVQGKRPLAMHHGWQQLPVEQEASGQAAVAHALRRDVLPPFGQVQQFPRDLEGDELAGPM